MKKKIAVIGGGIFGVTAAIILSKKHQVDLYEMNSDILSSASGINQFRIHRGYHYPRSNRTAISSLTSEPSFLRMFPESIIDHNDHYYCIAKENSQTSAQKYLEFCKHHSLEFTEANLNIINKKHIDLCLKVNESLIDPHALKQSCLEKLKANMVNVFLNRKATKKIFPKYDHIVIATYAALNELLDDYPQAQLEYQFELCEKIVCELPPSFLNKSVVVLDGPFMCFDPFGRTGKFLLGNVVHAIHSVNVGKHPIIDPQMSPVLNKGVINNQAISRFNKFIESGKKYFKHFDKAKYLGSMYTIRTVHAKKDATDERLTQVSRVNDKISIVFSGKIVSCVSAAIQLSKMIS